MSKKIIVAGAGHGGLVAAANLAENGYDVEVFESKQRQELGYDWSDTIDRDTFNIAGITQYDASKLTPRRISTLYAHSSKTPVSLSEGTAAPFLEVERKELYDYLIIISNYKTKKYTPLNNINNIKYSLKKDYKIYNDYP